MENINIEYYDLKDIIEKKKKKIFEIEKNIKILKKELNNDIIKLQSICNHEYERECTTTGCYAEYDYICKHCNKYR